MKVYTTEQMRRHEQMTVDSGSSFAQLMENAGRAAAQDLIARCPHAGQILMVCGKGNNGGDGLVMARILHQHGWQVYIVFIADRFLSDLAEQNRLKLLNLPNVHFIAPFELAKYLEAPYYYDVVVDAIFGTGFDGNLPPAVAICCRQLNGLKDALKVALDLPTGLHADTAQCHPDAFRADLTYTFAAHKPAHVHPVGQGVCGEVVCLDIGVP